ncbi:hypothetical protein PSAB6_410135 [Paraburkholderia sabiae]|jgi:hypothetical protein|nr:hypothetical protein PSAB6_410135 [Paraburkholderia sabiae]
MCRYLTFRYRNAGWMRAHCTPDSKGFRDMGQSLNGMNNLESKITLRTARRRGRCCGTERVRDGSVARAADACSQ